MIDMLPNENIEILDDGSTSSAMQKLTSDRVA